MKHVLPKFLNPTRFLICFWLISFRAFFGRFSTPFDPSTDNDLLRLDPASDLESFEDSSPSPFVTFPLQDDLSFVETSSSFLELSSFSLPL
jgi:hypothetical protein